MQTYDLMPGAVNDSAPILAPRKRPPLVGARQDMFAARSYVKTSAVLGEAEPVELGAGEGRKAVAPKYLQDFCDGTGAPFTTSPTAGSPTARSSCNGPAIAATGGAAAGVGAVPPKTRSSARSMPAGSLMHAGASLRGLAYHDTAVANP